HDVTRAEKLCTGFIMRFLGDGFNIPDGIIVRLFPRRCSNSIAHWLAGPIESTKSCVVICEGRDTGSHASRVVIPLCSLTGRWVRGVAPWREPYELRGSRTVLRERRGEIPRRYSPGDSGRRTAAPAMV